MPTYAIYRAELFKLWLNELKTIVSPKFLDLSPSLILNQSLELLEHGECLIFLSQEVNPNFAWEIIKKNLTCSAYLHKKEPLKDPTY